MLPDSELTKRDYLLAFGLGGFVTLMLFLWGYPGTHPSLWNELAQVAGVVPPSTVIPGLWRWPVSLIYSVFGPKASLVILGCLGKVCGGLLTTLAYIVINETLPTVIRMRMRAVRWSRSVVRLSLAAGSLLFAFSDPVWRLSQMLTPESFAFLLTLVAFFLLVKFLQTASRLTIYVSMLICGLLASESPVGIFYAVAEWWIAFTLARESRQANVGLLSNPVVRTLVIRRITDIFIFGLVLGAAANATWFCRHGGLAANGLAGVDLLVRYLKTWVTSVHTSATWTGWLFLVAVAVAPLVMAVMSIGRATRADKILPYRYGLLFLFLGMVSYLQLSGWQSFWFWTWAGGVVGNGYFLSVSVFLCAVTLTYSLGVLIVEVFFRNNVRIINRRYADDTDMKEASDDMRLVVVTNVWRRRLTGALIVVLLLLVLPYRYSGTARRMIGIVNRYLDEIVEEATRLDILFTDGTLDRAVELRARERGRRLITLSMLSRDSEYEKTLRRRAAFGDKEDEKVLAASASDTLRNWVQDKPHRLERAGVQVGVELWKRAKQKLPRCSGLMAFPGSLDDLAAENGRIAANDLVWSVLDLWRYEHPDRCPDKALFDAFLLVQWRLSRFCRMRADENDVGGRHEEALEETRLADELDEHNPSYRQYHERVDWINLQRGTHFTPREALRLALERADFNLAAPFARQVLSSDPLDERANFALGMSYFMDRQLARAETYLKRVLERRPNDVAALNNLAVIAIRQEKVADALKYASQAQTLAPNLIDVRRTYEKARELEAEWRRRKGKSAVSQ